MTDATADIFDSRPDDFQSVSLQLQTFGGLPRFHGTIRTIRCFEDNGLVKQVLQTPGHGSVLVVDGGMSLRSALMGDMIAASAVEQGWAGVIIFGAIRDRAEIAKLALGVKALGSNPRKSSKASAGSLDEVLAIDDVTFRPGAEIFCDEDGVLVEF
jgi:regulator of ribonuclease activity A